MSEPTAGDSPFRIAPHALSQVLTGLVQLAAERTPARLFAGRAGPAYRTATQLSLRRDHAAAVDAVHAQLNLLEALGPEFVSRWNLFEVRTQARTRSEYLLRPDLGRKFDEASRNQIAEQCSKGCQAQIVIGDGLSAAAVKTQVPTLLPSVFAEFDKLGWRLGRPFGVRNCRVGILNDIGELLNAEAVILLIGERPGLATAESLSAYMAYRPRFGHTDAQRNLISNIHSRGVPIPAAAIRIARLAEKLCRLQGSGIMVKEDLLPKRMSLELGNS